MTRAKHWQRLLATRFFAQEYRSGKVFTSKYNRAYETAVITGFKDIEKTTDLTEGGLVVSPNENSRRSDAFRKLLAIAPARGTNTILITHKPNIIDTLGKEWFDVNKASGSSQRMLWNKTSTSPV